jgi:hypothetical protein
MAIILISKKKRMQVFNLDSRAMMARSKRVKTIVMMPHRSGAKYPKEISKRIPDSLTVPAMAKVRTFSDGSYLPDDIVDVPCIAAAIGRRELRAVKWDSTQAEKVKAKASKKVGGKAAAKSKATATETKK